MNQCSFCKKPIRELRKGSLTGWISGAWTCTCRLPQTSPAPASQSKPLVPTVEDGSIPLISQQYEVVEKIAEGGMGIIYKAQDKTTGGLVCIKLIRPELSRDPQSILRFEQEVEATSNLSHPNIAKVIAHGTTECDGTPYMVMELIEGRGLDSELACGRVSNVHRLIRIATQIAEALKHAHSHAVIHRDLKPSNIILHSNGIPDTVSLVDFGIAKIQDSETRFTTDLTQSGEVFGTPTYMSPEQCLGLKLDQRSDIYSLGCILYEMASGHPPFAGLSSVQTIAAHLAEKPKTIPPGCAIPDALSRVIHCCLEKNADARYQSCESLLTDLNALQTGKKVLVKPRLFQRELQLVKILGLGLLFAFLVVTGPFFLSSHDWFLWAKALGFNFIACLFGLAIITFLLWPGTFLLLRLQALNKRIATAQNATSAQQMKRLFYSSLSGLLLSSGMVCTGYLAYHTCLTNIGACPATDFLRGLHDVLYLPTYLFWGACGVAALASVAALTFIAISHEQM